MNKKYIFFDMDGTLTEWKSASTYEELFEKGYFLNLKPQMSVVETANSLIDRSDAEVYVLTAVLDSKYAYREKLDWLLKYMPKFDVAHFMTVQNGTEKSVVLERMALSKKIEKRDCILLDDYTPNLRDWASSGGTAVKMLNGVNFTHQTWTGNRVCANKDSNTLLRQLQLIAMGKSVKDKYKE